ncbi:hypothetical protein C8Q79DRAFT_343829 [Trametes meyenii]|nr:hypothetical protein C8Q79DRAFT_343829 [Trametes meyenii]
MKMSFGGFGSRCKAVFGQCCARYDVVPGIQSLKRFFHTFKFRHMSITGCESREGARHPVTGLPTASRSIFRPRLSSTRLTVSTLRDGWECSAPGKGDSNVRTGGNKRYIAFAREAMPHMK